MNTSLQSKLSTSERRRRAIDSRRGPVGDPTPEELAERTAAVRSSWSEEERHLRYWQSRTFYGAAQLAEQVYTFPQLRTIDWSMG